MRELVELAHNKCDEFEEKFWIALLLKELYEFLWIARQHINGAYRKWIKEKTINKYRTMLVWVDIDKIAKRKVKILDNSAKEIKEKIKRK